MFLLMHICTDGRPMPLVSRLWNLIFTLLASQSMFHTAYGTIPPLPTPFSGLAPTISGGYFIRPLACVYRLFMHFSHLSCLACAVFAQPVFHPVSPGSRGSGARYRSMRKNR
jgi:hypothetical protein